MSSSPDPLHDTPVYQSTRPVRSSRPRQSLPLQASSPTKQTFELDIGNQRLPQKIRVTVEAGSDIENDHPQYSNSQFDAKSPSKAPIKGVRARTTTTTVPVKGLSDSETEEPATPKRGRGRPRKSATPVPAKSGKRASTPIRKTAGRRKSIGDLVDGDDEDDEDFSLGKNVEITRRGRPRSTSTKGKPRKSLSTAEDIGFEPVVSSTTTKNGRSRGRRKSSKREEVADQTEESLEDLDNNQEIVGVVRGDDLHSNEIDGLSSAYSTIRSTLPAGKDVDDIVVARFDPGNETPRRPGWSSPRYVEAPQAAGLAQDQNDYPSPDPSPTRLIARLNEQDPTQFGYAEPQQQALPSDNVDDAQEESPERVIHTNGFDEPQEFDTILESEGFSMISVDSVPSLREHLSSPANQTTADETASPARHAHAATPSMNSGARTIHLSDASTKRSKLPSSKQQNLHSKLLSVQRTSANDSFSSVAPEVLDAASPVKTTLVPRLLGRMPVEDDSFSSVAPEVLEAASPVKLTRKTAPSPREPSNDDNGRYEDSFSAIPSAILDAATPAPVRQMLRKAQTVDPIRLFAPVPTSISTRLLTPDETPSPPGDGSNHQLLCEQSKLQTISTEANTVPSTTDESSLLHSHIASSPPALVPRRYTYTAHLRQHRQLHPDMTQTPSIVFSSPTLPPPVLPNRGEPSLASQPDQGPRPTLSPIVRAGRVLQHVLVPANSPRSRAQSLGSPFKSPVADRHQLSFAERENPSSKDMQSMESMGLGLQNISTVVSRIETSTKLEHQDDPFGSNAHTSQRSPSPEEKQEYFLGLPQHRQLSSSRFSGNVSLNDSVRSDDAMSWQAEQEIALPTSTASLNKISSPSHEDRTSGREPMAKDSASVWEQKWAAERAMISKKIASAAPGEIIIIDSDDAESDCEDQGENEDDEDFGLLLETLNSSSPAHQQAPMLQRDTVEKPRRSKLPSPWRKNSKRLVYSDELYNLSATSEDLFGLPENPITTKPSSNPITVRRAMPEVQESKDAKADLAGWHIPQKSNFQPRERTSAVNADLSALFASSPTKPLPAISRPSRKPMDQSQAKSTSFQSVEIASHAAETTDEIIDFAPIPQKMDFKPRSRKSSFGSTTSSPIKAPSFGIFGGPALSSFIKKPTPLPSSSSAHSSKALAPSSPSKTNSLPYPSQLIPPPQPSPTSTVQRSSPGYDTSSVSIDEKENAEINQRTMKWTESLILPSTTTTTNSNHTIEPLRQTTTSTSPTKSCLRSPLKTPLRPTHTNSTNHAPSQTPTTTPLKTVTFASSSPLPSSPLSPLPPPLSLTSWTRDHWVLLDSILQTWKPENQSPDQSQGGKEGRKGRNSTRVVSKLLGRKVSSQGEEMRLEQWHLEVVDEFRGRVNVACGEGEEGWDEKVIARRVFALLVGERRRREGLIVD